MKKPPALLTLNDVFLIGGCLSATLFTLAVCMGLPLMFLYGVLWCLQQFGVL